MGNSLKEEAMTLHDMCDLIEDIGKAHAWILLEAEIVPQTRARQRLLFFQALHNMKESWPIEERVTWPDEFLQWEE